MKAMKYTITDFRQDFPDDDACLEWLKDYLYPDGIYCPKDKKVTPHHKLRQRKAYSCELCGHHTYPTANTIFHKSRTPLTLWFYAVYLVSTTRAGISAKQLERELGVTYKTAWRMMHQIRKMMGYDEGQLEGEVEVDEMYLGGNPMKRSTAKARNHQIIFGAVERGGRAKVKHVKSSGKRVLEPEIVESVKGASTIYSDEWRAYKKLPVWGFTHHTIKHSDQQYVKGHIHTQNVENLWSNMKRGIKGVYRHVDAKYLQAYADEYGFRYSHRNDYQPMFWALLGKVGKSSEKLS
jgi:transposase-like protein